MYNDFNHHPHLLTLSAECIFELSFLYCFALLSFVCCWVFHINLGICFRWRSLKHETLNYFVMHGSIS